MLEASQLQEEFYRRRTVYETLKVSLEMEMTRRQTAEALHAQGLVRLELLKKSIEAMKMALVPLTERGLGRLTQLLSYGLGVIFPDRDYSIDIEVSERGNDKTAEFFLVEGPLRVRLRDSVGGGVLSAVSVILRIFFILHYRDRRILVLDEPFSDINTVYIEGLFKFLQYVRDDLGFKFLMVTQDVRFRAFEDKAYRVRSGEIREVTRGGK